MSNFPTPLEEVIHHNVIKNNKTGGPALEIGPMQLLWRALRENTGYTFSIFETTVVPGMGIPLHKHPYAEFFYVLEGELTLEVEYHHFVLHAHEGIEISPGRRHQAMNRSTNAVRMIVTSQPPSHGDRMVE